MAASSTQAADRSRGTEISCIHSDILKSHIFKRLDGAALASTSSASAMMYSLCSDDSVWSSICNSTWPSTADAYVRDVILSFRSGHRAFYTDSFLAVGPHSQKAEERRFLATPELISAVDIHCDDTAMYSKVILTSTLSPEFSGLPFRINLLGPEETVVTPIAFDEIDGDRRGTALNRLRVSWIMIDPINKRAVNVAGQKSTESHRNWLNEEQIGFETVVSGASGELVLYSVLVTCSGKKGEGLVLTEVKMEVENMEGAVICGSDGLEILQETMEMQRSRGDARVQKEIYEKFLRMEIPGRRREHITRDGWISTWISVFVLFWILFYSPCLNFAGKNLI